jgi:endonuclease YncB( thermonuclease family)
MSKSIQFHMHALLLVIVLLVFPCFSFASQYKSTRVVDGDTIKVANNGNQLTIRFVGIDAPETSRKKREAGQSFSQKSTKYLTSLVLNKMVEIKSYGKDRYGRTLGVVFVNDINVNLEMVKAGLAEVYWGSPAPGFDDDPYWEAEKEARQANKGMWVQGAKYVSPREWRKMQRN